MADYLDKLARTAQATIRSGYYAVASEPERTRSASFVKAIRANPARSLVAEVKPASPSSGKLLGEKTPCELVDLYASAGVIGLSVLTEPVYFDGSLDTLRYAAGQGLPVLFKDFVLDLAQLDAATACGASAVLLILALFERGYATLSLEVMIHAASERGLEVLLEVYDQSEYESALQTCADMIGINNRDLKTLAVDLNTTARILNRCDKDRLVWSLSGIHTPEDARTLCRAGADALLIGTALMQSEAPRKSLEQLLEV